MRTGRWSAAAAFALVLATLAGAVELGQPSRAGLERRLAAAPDVATSTPSVAESATVPDEVAIVPPDEDLTGPLAAATPLPPLFDRDRALMAGAVLALVVGIDDYPGRRSDLGSAVADADTIEAALAGFGVPAPNRVVLRDGQARRAPLVAAIEALVDAAGPATTVVFAYAGHARKVRDGHEAIVAADGGLLRDTELAAMLAPLTTQPVWLLIASCYAGGFSEALAPGRILTGAADANSLAYESRSINGSYLVHHLVREGWLYGASGPSIQEAFSYARSRIHRRYPGREPIQLDRSDRSLRLGASDPSGGRELPPDEDAPAAGASADETPPTSEPPSDPPERRCSLLVICRRD